MSASPLIFAYPDNEILASRLADAGGQLEQLEVRSFPDGESHVCVLEQVEGRRVTLVCSLAQPDSLFLRLAMIAHTLRDLGASHLTLVAPYLSYMRQDERFHPGEGITSRYFARQLSALFDELITVDPHLHRVASLGDIYTLSAHCVSAAPALASWVSEHIERPVIVGPDSESEQWVEALARRLDAPSVVFEKVRRGDRDVHVHTHPMDAYKNHHPVILDDIISTGQTLARTVSPLVEMGFAAPTCLGVHAVFSDDAKALLESAGAGAVITTNTITHESNGVDVFGEIVQTWRSLQ